MGPGIVIVDQGMEIIDIQARQSIDRGYKISISFTWDGGEHPIRHEDG